MTSPAASSAGHNAPAPAITTSSTPDARPELVLEDLIEEVSIDGMCGVY